jgi:AraC-like DNA-binding protein
MLYLDAAWCAENVQAPGGRSITSLDSAIVIRDDELFSRFLEFVTNLTNACLRESTVQIQRLLNDAVSSCGRAPAQLPFSSLAQRIKRALLDDLESPPSLDDLAHTLGCRKETLIRTFRRQFHTTPYAFLNNARIEKAKQRLKAGEKIADVAVDLGFCDQSQLHRTFVRYTASTPGQYSSASSPSGVNNRQELARGAR